jgi:ribosomal protein S18 acetylase RimI-like enzyme
MSMNSIYFTIAVIFCIVGVGWLVLVTSSLAKKWSTEPNFRILHLWRLLPPLQLLSLFIPQLFAPELGFRNPWFLFGYITFILLVGVPYIIGIRQERKKEKYNEKHKAQIMVAGPEVRGTVNVIPARDKDYNGAGAIFAEVFGNTLDQTFGHNRTQNGLMLGELLQLRPGELYVAIDDTDQVVGAMWLDQGKLPKLKSAQILPILKKYLDHFNALYGAYIGVPSMMARRGASKRAYIQWLGVAPASQNHHIGTQLLEHAECLARQDKHKMLALHTETNNHRARAFYKRFGMVEQLRIPFWMRVYLVKKMS